MALHRKINDGQAPVINCNSCIRAHPHASIVRSSVGESSGHTRPDVFTLKALPLSAPTQPQNPRIIPKRLEQANAETLKVAMLKGRNHTGRFSVFCPFRSQAANTSSRIASSGQTCPSCQQPWWSQCPSQAWTIEAT